jgi:predicted aconitase with swiveling domain
MKNSGMKNSAMKASPLLPGDASGDLLLLDAPLSFWGGVDPKTGMIIQVRHPQCGTSIAGRILCLPATIGSSSSSAVLLELIRGGNAPAALVMGAPDAILLIGCLIAREMGWEAPPAFELAAENQRALADGRYSIGAEGMIQSLNA